MSPRISFLVGGVQKGGTTALAAVIVKHPDVALPGAKEAHVFDAPDVDAHCSVHELDRRFSEHFSAEVWADTTQHLGDATPITMFHPALVERVARYNPAMRWIVLLREPVSRAISQWHMERARGTESWPMWAAFLLENFRTRSSRDDFSDGSPLRHHSYLARGRYREQCAVLFRWFPREQVLFLRTEDLAERPASVLRSVWAHVGVDAPAAPVELIRTFEGGYPAVSRWHPARWIARAALRADDPWGLIEEECPRG